MHAHVHVPHPTVQHIIPLLHSPILDHLLHSTILYSTHHTFLAPGLALRPKKANKTQLLSPREACRHPQKIFAIRLGFQLAVYVDYSPRQSCLLRETKGTRQCGKQVPLQRLSLRKGTEPPAPSLSIATFGQSRVIPSLVRLTP